jgi:hypothetical protein
MSKSTKQQETKNKKEALEIIELTSVDIKTLAKALNIIEEVIEFKSDKRNDEALRIDEKWIKSSMIN